LAIIFLWFGLLKLTGLCPLAGFVCRTLPFLRPEDCLLLLGGWEVAVGICLVMPRLRPFGLVLLLVHLVGTPLPFILLPDDCFVHFPYALTLEGQYIVKNLTLASAALLLLAQQLQRPAASTHC
jgi:hypothetical protein